MEDIRRYYGTLELHFQASQSEIKSAYRRLAKEHHPDQGREIDDARIKQLNEAYSVLRDPNLRADYDSECIAGARAASEPPTEPIEPLTCSGCGKYTAQPRHLIFWRVYSYVVGTTRSPVQGIYCAACARGEATKSTLITALAGWWGIPWGPVWTLGKGFTNAIGGERDKARDQALHWYNVLAFTQAGQIPIAYSLAETLEDAEDEDIRNAAREFTALCVDNGFQPQGRLKDAWAAQGGAGAMRLASLAVLPAALALWIFAESAPSSPTPLAMMDNASPTYADYDSSAFEPARQPVQPNIPPPPPVELCDTQISNGEILAGRENLVAMGHDLEIDNGSAGNAIAKVRNAATDALVVSFYIDRNRTASIEGLPDGTYNIQYATGGALAADCRSFAEMLSVGEFPGDEGLYGEYVNDYRGEGTMYSRLGYTLYTVAGGNVRPRTISPEEFNSQ